MTDINDLNLDASLENLKFTSSDQKFEIPNANVKAFSITETELLM